MISQKLLIQRVAVSAFFFTNGFLYANWTARLPELQRYFGLNNSQLGTVLFCIALGSMTAMPFAGWLGNRLGSDKVVRVTGLLFCVAVPLVALSQNEWVIRACFFFLGATSGSMDVSMNSQAVLVERLWGKIIFSSFHAVFSIGMALGAATGGLFAGLDVAMQPHLWALAGVGMLLILWASTQLIPDALTAAQQSETSDKTDRWLALKTILPFGLIAFCCMTGEGAMVDWSAIYVNKIVGQNEVISAWAFGAFGVAMTIGRTLGDHFIEKWGMTKMLLIDAALSIVGLALVIGFVSVWSVFFGLFLVGLGVATIVPIVFSSAGNLPNVSPSAGISMASSIGYSGFFIGPPTIGYLAEAFDLRAGMGFVLGLFVLMAGLIVAALSKSSARQ
ncbi:MAG: MFS transporter [Spirosomaceae bacterium]|jgi:predicted MFS family arabinose efflux permease|nr:MFS transporter [Spirosomataceae bacterium]